MPRRLRGAKAADRRGSESEKVSSRAPGCGNVARGRRGSAQKDVRDPGQTGENDHDSHRRGYHVHPMARIELPYPEVPLGPHAETTKRLGGVVVRTEACALNPSPGLISLLNQVHPSRTSERMVEIKGLR
jgi:hypothetical protein